MFRDLDDEEFQKALEAPDPEAHLRQAFQQRVEQERAKGDQLLQAAPRRTQKRDKVAEQRAAEEARARRDSFVILDNFYNTYSSFRCVL